MELKRKKGLTRLKSSFKKFGTGREITNIIIFRLFVVERHSNIVGKVNLPDANGEFGYLHKIAKFGKQRKSQGSEKIELFF